jgi:hypothetical protein
MDFFFFLGKEPPRLGLLWRPSGNGSFAVISEIDVLKALRLMKKQSESFM